jgi:hypothetical protein
MSLTKNLNTVSLFHGFFVLLILQSCSFYKTIEIDPINSETLQSLHESKKTIIVHNDKENIEYIFTDVVIENDSLKGNITPAPDGAKHQHHKKSFLRKKVKAYKPTEVTHLYTTSNNLSPGSFKIHLNDIRFIEIHKKDKGKNAIVNTGIVVGTVGVIVGIAAALTDGVALLWIAGIFGGGS